mmetsp:Transcript_28713/g.60959  ORF Transcript_28713/g.60959 Transcript_28713/m.60959 type:complete len:575 (-) Transcript_28713:18-1742(-)
MEASAASQKDYTYRTQRTDLSEPEVTVGVSADSIAQSRSSNTNGSLAATHFDTSLGSVVRPRALCLKCTALVCLLASNFVLPIICGVQMIILDWVLWKHFGPQVWNWLWAFVLAELALVVHMLLHAVSTQAVRSGSLQWIVYSWLIAAKSGVLYFEVIPKSEGAFFDGRRIVTVLSLTPVFYCVLTFRTLRQLFRPEDEAKHHQHHRLHPSGVREKQEHVTLDVVLLTDMVWHVVIDMIDIIYMIFLSANPENPTYSTELKQEVATCAKFAGVFVCLGFFFHQQSFPSIGYVAMGNNEPSPEYSVDVVKARKRSAIVSILFVDLPFFIIRTYLYVVSISADAEGKLSEVAVPVNFGNSSATAWMLSTLGSETQLDKWWVKNILCMLLQAMQLRFVQQADLERSQNLRWWDVRRSGADTGGLGGTARRRRGMHDPHLKQIWQEMDRDKLGAALEDTGGLSGSDSEARAGLPGGESDGADSPGKNSDNSQPDSMASGLSEADPQTPSPTRRRSRFIRTCRRRCRCLRQRRCCCSCDFSHDIILHTLMGFILGWVIARIDFTQVFNDLLMGLGVDKT